MSTNYVIFGRSDCRFCEKAQDLLVDKELPFVYWDVREEESMATLLDDMGLKTVPQVWCGPNYIGNYDRLKDHLKARYPTDVDTEGWNYAG
jgi:glutaredoxin 1